MQVVLWSACDGLFDYNHAEHLRKEISMRLNKKLQSLPSASVCHLCTGSFGRAQGEPLLRKADVILAYFPRVGNSLRLFVTSHRRFTGKTLILIGQPPCCEPDPRITTYYRLGRDDYLLMTNHGNCFEEDSLDDLCRIILDREKRLW